ncbi:hypothetical protein AMTRI_Chr07g30170 [Amborella trichopoda]
MKMGMVVRSPSFFFFLPFILALSIQSSVLSTVDLEAEALLNWKTSLKNHTLVSWFLKSSNPTSHCSWIGIKCNDDGSVVEVNLPDFDLEGTLNQLNFFLLPHLTSLNLYNNHFTGSLPPSIGNLSKLTNLDLSGNNFTGSLPPSIGNLSKLTHFSLFGNHFTGSFPPSIGNLFKLTNLDLSGNNFTGSLPPSIGNLSKLSKLWLRSHQFTGSLPPSIGNLSKLTKLDLSGNNFTGSLPPSIRNLSKLTQLWLSYNNFTGSLPPSIGNISMLSTLHLSNNKLMGSLPPEIWNLKSIYTMDLSSNRFQGQLIHTASDPQGLQLLYNYDNFSGNTRLGLGKKFEMLNISSSTDIRSQICKSMKLLPGFLKHCTSTVTIREVACYDLVNTTETYVKLPNLEVLRLSNNQISGCISENIGEVGLMVLQLYKNKLMGPIPTSMGNLKNLTILRLRGNTLSGQIPSSFKHCTQLELLDLGDNQLSGNFPSWIGQSLTSLRFLYLRSNKHIGAIPKTMSSLYSLQVFDAAENCLSGTIPDIFTNFIAMKVTEKMADYNYDLKHNFYYMVRIDIMAKRVNDGIHRISLSCDMHRSFEK